MNSGINIILTDTVRFIRHIPHDLIDAFRATMEEIREADLLLHVVDASDEHRHAHMQQVNQIIAEIGASDIPQIEIYNKIDKQDDLNARIESGRDGINHVMLFSPRVSKDVRQATSKEGVEP